MANRFLWNRPRIPAYLPKRKKKFKITRKNNEICQINSYITSGQAKLLSPEEKNNTSFIANYIPHHGVLNINKPDRVRVVFDASAKINKTCLSDNLLRVIDLLNNLVSVITKFRNGKYGIIGDIEKMFHQVFIDPKDVDSLKFLWRDNPENPILDCQLNVHLFGKVDSPLYCQLGVKKILRRLHRRREICSKQ